MEQQFQSVLKDVCSRYPYQSEEGGGDSLKSEGEKISSEITWELQKRLNFAGVRIIRCVLTDLSYAEEIAQAMLVVRRLSPRSFSLTAPFSPALSLSLSPFSL